MKADIERRLHILRKSGSLARSECSAALLRFIAPLLAGGVCAWEKIGAGKRLAVRHPEALQNFITQQFPQTAGEIATAPSRVQSVARFRDSKTLANDTPEIVCLRGWSDAVFQQDGEKVPLARTTSHFGVFAFLLDRPERHALRGHCAVLENPAVFLACEKLGLPVDCALLGGGRSSNRLLDWLAAQSDLQILHLPDYDPIGLTEHERWRKRLGQKVRLHLPAHLPELFTQYGNREILRNPTAQAALSTLRSTATATAPVVALIDRHNAVLEQEALLLS